MSEFIECDTCRAKPGSPVLCRGCLSNRELIGRLERQLSDYQQHLGNVVTYGTSAESLDKQLQKLVPRAREADGKLEAAERDAAKWRAVCTPWTDDDENGVSTWQGYAISHWTGEAMGPGGFRFDEGDIEAAKAACLEHFKTQGRVLMDIESTLTAIRELKEERDWLNHKLGFLLTTLSLDRNRETLRRFEPKDLEELFRIVDKERADYSLKFPGEPADAPLRLAATHPELPDGKYLRREPDCWWCAMEVMGGFVHSKKFAPSYRPHVTELGGEWVGPLPDDHPEWNEAAKDCMGRLLRDWKPVPIQ